MELLPTPTVRARSAHLLAAVLLAAGTSGARAAELQITWEKDLDFEWDRANYERTLRETVRTSEAEVSSWLGWPRTRPLEVRVITRAH